MRIHLVGFGNYPCCKGCQIDASFSFSIKYMVVTRYCRVQVPCDIDARPFVKLSCCVRFGVFFVLASGWAGSSNLASGNTAKLVEYLFRWTRKILPAYLLQVGNATVKKKPFMNNSVQR